MSVNDEFKYPSSYELTEIFEDIATNKFINKFAQRRGIFLTNKKQSDLADFLSNFYYDESDLQLIKNEAYQIKSVHALSGFVIKSEEKNYSLKNAYENMVARGDYGNGKTLDNLRKISKKGEPDEYRGSLTYIKTKVARIQFLQYETSHFDFYINDLSNGNWQVEIDCTKSNDAKELKDLFEKNVLNSSVSVEIIENKLLDTEQSVVFFDELGKIGLGSDWELTTIVNLTIKHGEEKDDEETDEQDDINIVQENVMQGIKMAILQGNELRDDPFVIEKVGAGFCFTSMTYELQHKKQPIILQIKAGFKGRPKIFEVSIQKSERLLSLGQIREPHHLTASEDKAYRSLFWNNSKEIFNKLIKRKG